MAVTEPKSRRGAGLGLPPTEQFPGAVSVHVGKLREGQRVEETGASADGVGGRGGGGAVPCEKTGPGSLRAPKNGALQLGLSSPSLQPLPGNTAALQRALSCKELSVKSPIGPQRAWPGCPRGSQTETCVQRQLLAGGPCCRQQPQGLQLSVPQDQPAPFMSSACSH